MSTYFFNTNMKCAGCVSQIEPHLKQLGQAREIDRWKIYLEHLQRVLEVETTKMSPEQVKHAIRNAGFDAEFTSPPVDTK